MPKPHKLADGRYECQNCLRKFTKNPSPKAVHEPKFCGDACRKEFHANGGMSLKRLTDVIERKAAAVVNEKLTALETNLLSKLAALTEIVNQLPKRRTKRK